MDDENFDKWNQMARMWTVILVLFTVLAVTAIIMIAAWSVSAQAPACTVYYHAGVVTCAQPPALTATATQKPKREQSSDAGYPAPGDPEPSATLVMPYPPPISGDPDETPIPTRTDRPTPTLAPDCSIPPNASVWRCENGTGVPVSEATVTYTAAP